MIYSFADKELELCWRSGRCEQLPEAIRNEVLMNLTVLDAATCLEDVLHVPGCPLQPLPGKQKGMYSLIVDGPWHLVFRYEHGVFCDIWLKRHQYSV